MAQNVCAIPTYTTGTLGTVLDTISYGYGDTSWHDLLTSYDGQALTSDAIGNLTNDGTWSYTWQHGRQLKQMSRPDGTGDIEMVSFCYDSSGHRIGKDSGTYHISYSGGEIIYVGETTRTSYSYLGDTLTQVSIGSTSLRFTYDVLGPASVVYNGTTYYYLKNAQGDVIGIVNASGTQVVAYTYDAWGKLLSTTGSMAGTLGLYNPLRYRSYVYDTETGLYYVSSRYYDPETCRFINADSQLNVRDGILGYNMFAYCNNNPVMYSDPSGHSIILACIIVGAVAGALAGGHIAAKVSKAKTGKVNGWAVAGGVVGGGIVGGLVGWGVGAAVTAIGAAATGTAATTATPVVGKAVEQYDSWQAAENALRNSIDSVLPRLERTFSTPFGNRVVDAFNSTTNAIAEAKYGYQGLSFFFYRNSKRCLAVTKRDCKWR